MVTREARKERCKFIGALMQDSCDGLKPETKTLLTVASKKKSKAGKGDTTKEEENSKNDSAQPITISLLFKRYVFDTQKKMIQS
ncbi:hypothetical protein Q9233_006998 [Columba guinea]|nr:hypothetical protein Q9233_006998 [Columba guinea]